MSADDTAYESAMNALGLLTATFRPVAILLL